MEGHVETRVRTAEALLPTWAHGPCAEHAPDGEYAGGHADLAPPAANSLRQRHIFARAPRRVINTPFPPKTGQKGPPKRPLWELAPCSGRAPPRWPVFPRPPTAGAPVAGWLHGEAQHCVQVSACLLEAVPYVGWAPRGGAWQ